MIDLRDRFPSEPAEFGDKEPVEEKSLRKWRKIRDARKAIERKIGNSRCPSSKDFSDSWKAYKAEFREAQYGGKCAYCETRIAASQAADVEHFRPKTSIQEPKGRGNRDDSVGKPNRSMGPEEYPGYWWLAYEWSNYLYACALCNRTWKGNSFPLNGLRGDMTPGCECAEEPMLLNPFWVDPESHLRFDEIGQIHATTDRGQATIDCCGLDRELLRREREKLVRRILQDFEDLAIGELTPAAFDRRIKGFCRPDSQYAGLAMSLIETRLTTFTE